MRVVSLSSSARRVEPKETLERNILSKIDVVPYVESLKNLQRFDGELSQEHIYNQIALRNMRVFLHFPPLSISKYFLLRLYLNHAPFQRFAKIVVYIDETKRSECVVYRRSLISGATSRSVLHSRSVFRVRARSAINSPSLSLAACSLRSSSGTALTVKVSAFHGHRDHARPTHSRLVVGSLASERSARTWPSGVDLRESVRVVARRAGDRR